MNDIAIAEAPVPAWMQLVSKPEKTVGLDSVLFYARPGRRKTSIAASIRDVPGFENVLFIDLERGSKVLNGIEKWADIDIVQINPNNPHAQAQLNGIIDDITTHNRGYNAVILDPLDVAQDIVERDAEIEFAHSTKNGGRDGFAVYRKIGEWTNEYVTKLHNCPWFLAIFNVHADVKKNEDGSKDIVPRLSGSAKESIGGTPDVVAYLEFVKDPQGNKRLLANMKEDPDALTKNRVRGMPDMVPDLTMSVIYDYIKKGGVKPAEKTQTQNAAAAA